MPKSDRPRSREPNLQSHALHLILVMKPTRLTREELEGYVNNGYWPRESMVERYRSHAKKRPRQIACQDAGEVYTWGQIDTLSERLAANLIGLGLARDERVMVQMPSSCREFVLRISLKKAGLIGVYVPMQWRERELAYALERLGPAALILPAAFKSFDGISLVRALSSHTEGVRHYIDSSDASVSGWQNLGELLTNEPSSQNTAAIANRVFSIDEVSLVTASSGTTGLAKLCEWPEGAQLCIGTSIAERLLLTPDDNVGVFAPMAGAAGALLWVASGSVPCTYTFPSNYDPHALLQLVERSKITVATTVPVILARLAQEDLETYDLYSLRALRVGTAAVGRQVAASFESRTGCRVVPAAGSMECPSFGHASADEPVEIRLNGSVGLPLPGCRVRIIDQYGNEVSGSGIGEVVVSAPFAASGYWRDPEATRSAWPDSRSGGWYVTGDLGFIDDTGRLTLVGRSKEIINRSGHKVLPLEIERIILQHPDVLECAVVASPDDEYGEVPWAFIQPRAGRNLNIDTVVELMRDHGVATYKIPTRFFQVPAFPRVNGNKIDKKRLLEMHGTMN